MTLRFVAYSVCLWIVFSGDFASADLSEGQLIFEKRCAVCHQLPDLNSPPEVGWSNQLTKMAPLARLDRDQYEDVLEFLTSHIQSQTTLAMRNEDRQLFEEKCSRCHSLERVILENPNLDDEGRRHILNRMQARSGTDWLSDDEVERILAYISGPVLESSNSYPNSTETSGVEQLFQSKCSACHSIESIWSTQSESPHSDSDWSHVIGRMRGKAPQWISETEAGKIQEYLESNE